MVPEGRHVEDVYLNPATGVLSAPALRAQILIDCSTVDIAAAQRVQAAVRARAAQLSLYDAPVSGGSLGAAAGTLTVMLGCRLDEPHLPLLRDVLSVVAATVVPCGGPTMGLTAKLCNNYCSGLIALATAEALDIGIKAGMDPTLLARVFATSTAQSTINDIWNPVPGVCPDAPASRDYAGGFKVQLMHKDFRLAVELAQRVGARPPLADSGLRVYCAASEDDRCRDRDSRVVFRYIGGDEDWMEKLGVKTDRGRIPANAPAVARVDDFRRTSH
ncbi:6-phosphogluconate dehydrogenase C-terminal domain-like protein [Aspergillus indologenus CBS 114.80]|uniref:3-hydroxyisobutyrate dehydrogenase n=1 Tax=Aspergillus indologenus CBS 114.80 TaxID=1450541 RepID=A0A2V5I8N7_9EURO|nr:6-phosphogluconate dehydrogenase C-terminal domain-like protein [Aspergillus indologenus CBS 114.80]